MLDVGVALFESYVLIVTTTVARAMIIVVICALHEDPSMLTSPELGPDPVLVGLDMLEMVLDVPDVVLMLVL